MEALLKNPPYPPEEKLEEKDIIPLLGKDDKVIGAVFKVQNLVFPTFMATLGVVPDPRTNLTNIEQMKVRDDDIFICAHGKAGTHWLWEITQMLKKGETTYEKKSKDSLMLEFHLPREFDDLPRPRVFNTHLSFDHLPHELLSKRCKILFIQRNPKDVMVSGYHHYLAMQLPGSPTITWDEYYPTITQTVMVKPFFEYTLEFEEALKERSDHILPLYFEDLKQDCAKEIKKIAEFLKIDCSDEFAQNIKEKCSFQNLKEADKQKENFMKSDMNFLYRKGEVGNWKNYFTVSQNEHFDTLMAEKMKSSKFTYKYTLD